MAYTRAWDEAAPAGAAAANTLDTIIQNKMKDLRERLEDAFPDWSDDTVDPKRVVVHSGTLANRPVTGDANTGEFYLATDTEQLFYFDSTGWAQVIANTTTASYDAAAGAFSRATSELPAALSLSFDLSGTTDGSGDLVVDWTEFDVMSGTSGLALKTAIFNPTSTACAMCLLMVVGAGSITVRFYDFAGAAKTGSAVTAHCFCTFFSYAP